MIDCIVLIKSLYVNIPYSDYLPTRFKIFHFASLSRQKGDVVFFFRG